MCSTAALHILLGDRIERYHVETNLQIIFERCLCAIFYAFCLQFLGTRHCFSFHIVEFTVVWIFQCTCLRMYSCTVGKCCTENLKGECCKCYKCCTEKLKGEAWKWIIVLPLRAASVIHLIYLQYHSGCNCSICWTFVLLFFFHENILGQNIILETNGTG